MLALFLSALEFGFLPVFAVFRPLFKGACETLKRICTFAYFPLHNGYGLGYTAATLRAAVAELVDAQR